MFIDRLPLTRMDPLLRMSFLVALDYLSSTEAKLAIDDQVARLYDSARWPSVLSPSSASGGAPIVTTATLGERAIISLANSYVSVASAAVGAYQTLRGGSKQQDVTMLLTTLTSAVTPSGFAVIVDEATQRPSVVSMRSLVQLAAWRRAGSGSFRPSATSDVVLALLQLLCLWLPLVIKTHQLLGFAWLVEECLVAFLITYINWSVFLDFSLVKILLVGIVNLLVSMSSLPWEFDHHAISDLTLGPHETRLFRLVHVAQKNLTLLFHRHVITYNLMTAIPILRQVILLGVIDNAYASDACALLYLASGCGHMWARIAFQLVTRITGFLYVQTAAIHDAISRLTARWSVEEALMFLLHLGLQDYAVAVCLRAAAYYVMLKVALLSTIYSVDAATRVFAGFGIGRALGLLAVPLRLPPFGRVLARACSSSALPVLVGVGECVSQATRCALHRLRRAYRIRSETKSTRSLRYRLRLQAVANYLVLALHAHFLLDSSEVLLLKSGKRSATMTSATSPTAGTLMTLVGLAVLWHLRLLPQQGAYTIRHELSRYWEAALFPASATPSQRQSVVQEAEEATAEEPNLAEMQQRFADQLAQLDQPLPSVDSSQSLLCCATRQDAMRRVLQVLLVTHAMPIAALLAARRWLLPHLLVAYPSWLVWENAMFASFYWYASCQLLLWILHSLVLGATALTTAIVFASHMQPLPEATDDSSTLELLSRSMRRHHRALLVVSVIQQVWQYIVYHLLNLGVVVFCIALYANASSRGTMSARHVVVLIVLTLRCVSAIGQLLRGLIRGVRASIPCDHTCVLARLPKLDARQIGELQDPCAICRCRAQGQDEMVRLECGHCFHVDCISDWLKIQMCCCLCRHELLPDGIPRNVIWRPFEPEVLFQQHE